MYFKTKLKIECCACTACEHACPVAAIHFRQDEEGFMYPEVDSDKCINCGLCERICPVEHPDYGNNEKPDVYASILKNVNERENSSSGGMFFAIASWIIEQGGVVYGATLDDSLQVKHIGVETLNDLYKLRGSKYVQSILFNIFADVRAKLNNRRWCYFVGTGCQIAGLKAYLRKDYPTLVTSDLVCHGVPSQKLFNEHIIYLENKYHNKVTNYQFRDYKSGNGCEIVYFGNRNPVFNRTYELSPYLYSFMYGLTCRYSCYNCKFAKMPRQGDITLADYWGVQHYFPQFDRSKGCSLILLNTEKGQNIWKKIKTNCEYMVSNIDDAAKFNGNLIHPTPMPEIRKTIYMRINEHGYRDVVKSYFRSPQYYKLYLINCILNVGCLRPFIKFYRNIKDRIKSD